MDELTDRQTAILQFISRHCRDSGYPPTVREIGFGVGLASPSTVHAHLAKLEAAGHIHRDPTKPRAMYVCRDAELEASRPRRAPVEALPLVGSVAAGAPRLAEQDVEDWVARALRGRFRPQGHRRVDDRRRDPRRRPRGGRTRQPTARDGEIVVAQIEDEATVKRLRRADGRVHLMPENDAFEPIVVDDVLILGVVVGVMRKL